MDDEERRMAVLMEHMLSQFRTFGEKLDSVEEKMDKGFQEIKAEISDFKMDNRNEHLLLKQMVQELNREVQKLDTEVVKLKRVK